jgi:hypothetical protein
MKKRIKMKRLITICAVAAMVIVSASSAVFGLSYTLISNPPIGEENHAQILHDIYGGVFSQSGVNYNGSTGIQALRVYDFGNDAIKLNLFTGTPNDIDKIWTDGVSTVTAKAKYAGLSQSFGWNQGGILGNNYEELLTSADIGGPGVPVEPSGDFLWGIHPGSGLYWWSRQNENNDQMDHMVTYQIAHDGITGAFLNSEPKVWLLFFEDLPSNDWDYNDFAVEVTCIPEPATIGLLGLGALSLLRRKHGA